MSPLDPQLFSSINDFAGDLLKGERAESTRPSKSRRGSTIWRTTLRDILRMPTPRRARKQTQTLVGLRPTAPRKSKSRVSFGQAARPVLYALFLQTGDQKALARAVERYRAAREAWTRLVEHTNGKFVDDVTFGPVWFQRGHWRDRLAAIDKDIAALEQAQPEGQKGARPDLIDAALAHSSRPRLQLRHTPPDSFRRGQPLTISVEAAAPIGAVTLRYRHTNQAENWQTAAMESAAQHSASAAHARRRFPPTTVIHRIR